MALELRLIDSPSQRHRVRLNGQDAEILFRYNVSADRWSMTIWKNQEKCPVLSGRVVIEGIDLFKHFDLDLGEMYCVTPGTFDLAGNWYRRLVDGVSRIIFTTRAEREALANGELEVIC